MKKLLFLVSLLICFTLVKSQNKNIQLLGVKPYPSPSLHGELNDVWGHVDSLGNEYALVGLEKGFSIVDVSDPNNLTEVFYVAGPSTIWRDIKTWDNHAYITNEQSGGLMIVDMSSLPGTILPGDVSYYSGSTYPFNSAHNIYIDENGVGYVFGADYGQGGAIMYDLFTNPKAPTEIGIFDSLYFHDGMVRGDTLWGAAVYDKEFFIIDVSTKSSPVILASKLTSGQFTHNCWISDDGNTLFTTDEISNGAIGSYDVADISNMDELDIIRSNPGSLVIPHNTHVYGNFLVTSYYRDGVTIVDATKPERMVQIGNYDTSPAYVGNGFNGAWGAYPYLPSGKLLVTDIENGLFVLGVDYKQGVYLQGNTLKFSDSTKVSLTQITCLNTNETTTSNLNGFYKESYADSAWYKFVFYKPGYLRDTVDILMQNGMSYVVDVYLRKQSTFTLKGTVIDDNSKSPVAQSDVLLIGKDLEYTAKTNPIGYFEIDSVFEGEYEVNAGKWQDYKTTCSNVSILDGDSLVLPIITELRDDFTFDNNWTVVSSASNGAWERSYLKFHPSFNSLDFPLNDVVNDCSDYAFVTGEYSISDHDLDGGKSTLISPSINASNINNAALHFSYWFKNDAPSGTDDTLTFKIVGASDTTTLFKVYNAINLFQSTWIDTTIIISEFGLDLSSFKLIIEAGDFGQDDLFEAGFDNLSITDAYVGILDPFTSKNALSVHPNPFVNELYIRDLNNFQPVLFELLDLSGKEVWRESSKLSRNKLTLPTNLTHGMYFLRVTNSKGELVIKKVIKASL